MHLHYFDKGKRSLPTSLLQKNIFIDICLGMAGNKRIRIVKCESISSQMRITSDKKFTIRANQLGLFRESFVLIVSQFD